MSLSKGDRTEIVHLVAGVVEDAFLKFKSEFFEKIDPVLKEVKATSKLKNHEDRIEKIETKLAD